MRKISSFLFSMLFTGIILVVFASAIAYATFIENDYGSITAKILIYNSWWFELLLVLLMINLTGSVFVHKLIQRKKWTVLLFHLAFIVIIIGAGITRYFGYEGTIHIRENEETDRLLSDGTYITISGHGQRISKDVMFSGYTRNKFKEELEINDKKVTVENLMFVPSAAETIVEDSNGEPIMALVAVDRMETRIDFVLRKGESRKINDITFSFEVEPEVPGVKFRAENSQIIMTPSDTVFSFNMGSEKEDTLQVGVESPIPDRTAFRMRNLSFVLRQYLENGKAELIYVPSHEGVMKDDAFHAKVTSGNQSKEVFVFGRKGEIGRPYPVEVGGISVNLHYGSTETRLPFSIRLNDFQIERYPGSNSPSSYASEVTLIDRVHSIERPYRIFMNNILKYKGYRFFQSSYDGDEKGTVLSVNNDPWGTGISYLGYLLMGIGMVLTFFNRNSRFKKIVNASAKLAKERKKIFSGVVLICLSLAINKLHAQTSFASDYINARHAKKFGELLVQSREGRIEPINTQASEILRKVARKSNYEGKSPVQVYLDMYVNPAKWKETPLIKISHSEIKKLIGITGNYASLNQLLTSAHPGNYIIEKQVNEAYEKKPVARTRFDKEIINVDERVNILYQVFAGKFLTIFPVPGDENHKWEDIPESMSSPVEEIAKSAGMYNEYIESLREAKTTGNYSKPDTWLENLKANQQQYGKSIIPSKLKITLENFYISFNLFGKLAVIYAIAGLLMILVQFFAILKPKFTDRIPDNAGLIIVLILFLIHSAGLGIRWHISGHAPWSNGYESLIYISWATCLAGLIFAKRSPVTLAMTTLLAAISLLVAGMSWMNPELTNLVPVLKSYWLIIHVAVITASYGFFAMGGLLGLFNLLLMIVRNNKNNTRVTFTIKELTLVIQIAMMIGLIMLTIGSFLGGVWANESWGRYWGWDPKETWALVTILVYSFVTHMHKIPGFRGSFALSTGAIAGMGAVLMTFFGVNYYLSGLHSYAQGEPAPIPTGVYISVFLIMTLMISAFISEKTFIKNAGQNLFPVDDEL